MDRKSAHIEPDKLGLHLLVLRAQVGDENAFRQLYEQFSDRTLRFLSGFVSQTAAEDLNQELWLTVYRRIRTLVNINGFRAWLFQSARNSALDQLRSLKRRDELNEILYNQAESRKTPEELEVFPEPDFELTNALDQLSASHREVIVLNYLEGMDYEEIALITGCLVGTVRSRIHHARRKLKENNKSKNKHHE